MIFAEGEPGDELFSIQKGSVKIVKVVDQNEVLLAVLKEGDIFGEMALLESEPRVASAIAYENCSLTVINRANFEQMISTQPQMIARLTTLLAERLWFIYKQLANTQLSDPLCRMYDALLIQLERKRVDTMSTQPFAFDFGPVELVRMVGISPAEGNLHIRNLLENRQIQILHDKIHATEIREIARQASYLRKKHQREGARKGYALSFSG
jgi:CRP-like cAMP-binding protein